MSVTEEGVRDHVVTGDVHDGVISCVFFKSGQHELNKVGSHDDVILDDND